MGPAKKQSQIKTLNIAPSWTRLLNSSTLFTLGFIFSARTTTTIIPATIRLVDLSPRWGRKPWRVRTLTPAGVRSNVSYVKGIHNLKAGAVYEQTFLNQRERLGSRGSLVECSLLQCQQ